MTDIKTHILQRVKDALGLSEELSSTHLYNLLYEARNLFHPDKHIDEGSKLNAQDNFSKLNNLLIELRKFIESENQEKKPSELILYKDKNEDLLQKHQIITRDLLIEDLKLKIRDQEQSIEKLKQNINTITSSDIKDKTEKLINQYKPSKRTIISGGIVFGLSFTAIVISKIDDVAQGISKYFPFGSQAFNYLVFSTCLLIPANYFLKYLREKKIIEISKRILTPYYTQKFSRYLEYSNDTFTDLQVYEFLEWELMPKRKLGKFLDKYLYDIDNDLTINSLKEIFIHNLLSNELISYVDSHMLHRHFKILKSYRMAHSGSF